MSEISGMSAEVLTKTLPEIKKKKKNTLQLSTDCISTAALQMVWALQRLYVVWTWDFFLLD